ERGSDTTMETLASTWQDQGTLTVHRLRKTVTSRPLPPRIRSPFSERLAPQSLILEVIGLGRAGPHCIAAYHSHCLRRSARPDPTGLIRPRGTRDNDSGLPECLSLPS